MIRQLISRVPIDKVIERDMRLHRSGHRYLRGIDHDSLVVDLERNLFFWNSIGIQGDALKWLTDIKGLSYREALSQLQKYSGLPFTRILDILEKPVPIYPKLLKTFFRLGKQYREYWYDRGFTDATLDFFQVGHTGKFHVVPIIVDGILENFQCRKIGVEKKLWRWSSNRPPYPFNTGNQSSKYVFMAEGLPDTMLLHQLGYPAICSDSGPQSWKKEWNRHIVQFDTIYLIFDNDEAGIRGARRTSKRLLHKAYMLLWPYSFPKKYDLNKAFLDLGEQGFHKFMEEVLLPNAFHSSRLPNRWDFIDALRMEVQRYADKYSIKVST